MFHRSTNPRQFHFREKQEKADRICDAARAANLTPTAFVRQAVDEKVNGSVDSFQILQRMVKTLQDDIAKLREQLASVAFEVKDFRERFDQTVVTAEDESES
jgi:hypothetical protein